MIDCRVKITVWVPEQRCVASRYRTSIAEDEAIIADETLGPRPRVAARLLRIEKRILEGTPMCHDAAHAADTLCRTKKALITFTFLQVRCSKCRTIRRRRCQPRG